MRRIEQLLITQGGGGAGQQRQQIETQNPSTNIIDEDEDEEDARLTGLLLLSLSRLQAYASQYLPLVIQEAFLEDLEDLANPQLARTEKLLVVSRVWRCFRGLVGAEWEIRFLNGCGGLFSQCFRRIFNSLAVHVRAYIQ